jgi:hypothetical protein
VNRPTRHAGAHRAEPRGNKQRGSQTPKAPPTNQEWPMNRALITKNGSADKYDGTTKGL